MNGALINKKDVDDERKEEEKGEFFWIPKKQRKITKTTRKLKEKDKRTPNEKNN